MPKAPIDTIVAVGWSTKDAARCFDEQKALQWRYNTRNWWHKFIHFKTGIDPRYWMNKGNTPYTSPDECLSMNDDATVLEKYTWAKDRNKFTPVPEFAYNTQLCSNIRNTWVGCADCWDDHWFLPKNVKHKSDLCWDQSTKQFLRYNKKLEKYELAPEA